LSESRARPLVTDTNVVVKFYLPEEGHDEAVGLLDAAETSAVELLAPGTMFPEGFNALTQQQRRGLLDAEDAKEAWEKLLAVPVYTYVIEDLIERAAQIARETGVIVYDALFLALAENTDTVVVTADHKLLKALRGTGNANLARDLTTVADLLE
jgi:predicted nucleic acid-binding protein